MNNIKKKNILFFSSKGEFTGGGQKSIFYLLERLNKEKYQPFLITQTDGKLVEMVRECGIETEIVSLPSLRPWNFISMCRIMKRLKEILKLKKIHLIHTESSRSALYFGFIKKFLKIPLILHARVSIKEPYLYEKLIYNLSSKIIAVSNSAKCRYANFVNNENKVQVIYNAVNLEEFNPEKIVSNFKEEIGITNEILVGIIGLIIPWKGQVDFIYAAKDVLEKKSKVKFVIVGKNYNNYQEHLEKLCKSLGIENKVIFIDHRDNIKEVIFSFDILVNASKFDVRYGSEGFSRIIIEAMALEKAVIVSNVGGNVEAIVDGVSGILFPQGDSTFLANAMLELIQDENKRTTMGKAARQRVEEMFSLEIQIKKIEELYDKIGSICE